MTGCSLGLPLPQVVLLSPSRGLSLLPVQFPCRQKICVHLEASDDGEKGDKMVQVPAMPLTSSLFSPLLQVCNDVEFVFNLLVCYILMRSPLKGLTADLWCCMWQCSIFISAHFHPHLQISQPSTQGTTFSFVCTETTTSELTAISPWRPQRHQDLPRLPLKETMSSSSIRYVLKDMTTFPLHLIFLDYIISLNTNSS